MSEQSERRRILDMLASGQINADQAEELLGALGGDGDDEEPRRTAGAARHAVALGAVRAAGRGENRKIARSVRIMIDTGGEEQKGRGRVAVTVPLALAKFAGKLIPEEVRDRLEDEGIELAQLLQALDQELPEGRLVDIDTTPGGEQGRRARIVVEVV